MFKKIISKFLKLAVILVISGLIFGSITQYAFDKKVDEEFVPKGRFVNTTQGKIHYDVIGSGDYTFVMEAGLGETMETWTRIKDSLAKLGRVFMYDRAGLGYSDESNSPRTSETIADQLHEVLSNADISGPYILVGHSIGGLHVRYFSNKYPKDVAGLFLIDPFHEKMADESPNKSIMRRLFYFSLTDLSWSGLPYFGLSRRIDSTYKTSKSIRTYGYEYKSIPLSIKEFRLANMDISHLPICIVSAKSDSESTERVNKQLYKELIDHSVNPIRKLIEHNASHNIHLSNSKLVIQDFKDFLHAISK